MVTYTKTTVKTNLALFSFNGLSTDTKPTETMDGIQIGNGSTFLEMDTRKMAFYNGTTNTWLTEE